MESNCIVIGIAFISTCLGKLIAASLNKSNSVIKLSCFDLLICFRVSTPLDDLADFIEY